MKRKRKVIWYIFTNDSYTNRVISIELPQEDTVDGVKCFDGVQRKLWRCDGTFITKILKNRKSQNLDFEIFKSNGKYGSIKKITFFK